MNRTIQAFALLAALGAPALQAQAPGERPSAQQRIDRATAALDLSAAQQAQLRALAERYANDDSRTSWHLAADVDAILTDEQASALAKPRRERRVTRGERPASAERKGRSDARHSRGKDEGRAAKGAHRLDLSDAQQEQMQAQRKTLRAQHDALREQLQSGALTAEQFASRSQSLREQSRAAFEATLTAEQRQKMDQAEARRDAEKAARETVLQITPAQKAAFESARAEAARAGEGRGARGGRAEILTDEQRQLVAVHRALSGGREQRDRKGGPGGRPGEHRLDRKTATE